MRIYSSSMTKHLVVLMLSLTTVCFGKKTSYNEEDLTALLGELKSVGSEEQESILKSLSDPKDVIVGEESKSSFVVRVAPENKGSSIYQVKKPNTTHKDYDFVQWYATPSRIVEHHVEGGKLESSIDSFGGATENNGDYKARSISSYEEDSSHNPHTDHYHVDHHHDDSVAHDNPNTYTSTHHHDDGANPDGPTSDVFYRKMKLKKVRRNCTRSKTKKVQGWPDRSDTIIHGRSNDVPEIPNFDANSFHQSLPAFPESRFNDVPKPAAIPNIHESPFGFSGEHLHGIPRTHFFHYKNGEGVNHYHLHNHNHIYDSNGKRINLDYKPTYRNLADHFGKLKSMLTTKESGSLFPNPTVVENYRSTLSLENPEPISDSLNGDSQKKGYHYTGTHESYGRKTYKRIYPDTKPTSFSNDGDKTIGMEMFRYGAGQYGTDEFSSNEEKGRYPNEVSLGIDKPYSNSGEIYEPIRPTPHHDSPHDSREYNSDTSGRGPYKSFNSEYNPNSDTSGRGPYKSYNSEFNPNYKQGGKDVNYNHNYEEKAPYEPQEKAPYVPQDKGSYGSPTPVKESISSDYHGGYNGPHPNGPRNPEDYPTPFNPSDDKNEPDGPINEPKNLPNSENSLPPKVDVTHSVSYSQDGEIDAVDYGPENFHLFQNIRPDIDPLTIPKNARVFEHHIRLHPMHYMYAQLARNPVNYPALYNNAAMYPVPMQKFPVAAPKFPVAAPKFPVAAPKFPVAAPKYPVPIQKYPVPLHKYPVPLHKLIPNPLKMPIVPVAPMYPRYPSVPLNQILRAYQGRSYYQPWW